LQELDIADQAPFIAFVFPKWKDIAPEEAHFVDSLVLLLIDQEARRKLWGRSGKIHFVEAAGAVRK